MEKQKLIYVESKAQFSPSEVSDKAIVFIKDTKEIWTHGVYFSCSGTWATPITLSLTGDTTGSVSIDGSGNASIATTTKYLSGMVSSASDCNGTATTQPGNVTYYPCVLNGAANGFPTTNNANGILSLNVHDYSYTHQLGFSSDGNIYHRRRSGGTWETSWKTILSSSNYTNFLDSVYLKKSGGTMTGSITLSTESAYINDTASGWSILGAVSASNTGTGVNGLATIFSGAPSLNMVLRTSGDNLYHYNHAKSARYLILDTNNYSTYALPLSGGTMTGALNFANNTWNKVGDDAYMGDCNVAGMIGIKGSNAATPGFAMYNNSGTLLGKLYASGTSLYWSDAKILTASGTSKQFVMGDGSLYSDTVSYTTWTKTTTSGIAWFPIADITDDKQGTALFMVKAYAHSSIIFTVVKGHNNGNINVLAGGGSFNNDYAYIKGVRQIGNVVEIGLNAAATYVQVAIRVLQPTFTYSLRSSLVESTSTTTPYVQYDINSGGNLNFGIISSKFTGNLVGNADTASNISTVNPILAQPFEKNTIQVVSNPQGALAEQQGAGAAITHALRFNWYNTAYEIGNVRGGASNSLGFGITYGNNNLCLLVKTNGTYSPYGFIGDLTGNAASANKWAIARTITLTGDVTGSVTLDGSSNVTLTTATAGTGTTSFLKCPDKRNSYPAQIVTSGGNIGAAFISTSTLGLSEGYYCDTLILRGYATHTAGYENALLFNKQNSSVYHSQYAFGSTTTWGTIHKFLDSNNYSSYALPLSGGTMTGKLTMQSNSFANLPQIYRTDGAYLSGIRFQNTLGYLGAIGMDAVSGSLRIIDAANATHTVLDSRNYTNYTINHTKSGINNIGFVGVINGNNLYHHSELSFARFSPTDGGGNNSYELIAELTNYNTGANTGYINYGISGFMWSYRGGNCNNSSAYPITAIVSIGPYTSSRIRVPVTTNVLVPFIVKYSNKYYLALRQQSSSTPFYFMGQKLNLLTTTIKVTDASLIEEIKGPEVETSTSKYYYNNGNPQEYLHAGNYSSYALPLKGGTLTGNITVPSAFINTGDATLKFYSGKVTDVKSDGNICLQTSIDGTDGESHVYPTNQGSRCNLVLQPRGGQVYIGTNPDGGNTSYKLYVNGSVYASSLNTGGTSSQFLKADGSLDSTSYLPTAGGTLTGILKSTQTAGSVLWASSIVFTGNVDAPSRINNTYSHLASNLTTGGALQIFLGKAGSTYNGGSVGYWHKGGDGNSGNALTFGLYGADNLMVIQGNGNVGINNTSPSYKLTVGGDIYSSGYIRAASGFMKTGSGNSYVLLGGGSHKAVSDFAPNNVATLSSSGMGNSDQWTLVLEQSYPASHWYEPIAMFYVKGATVGCGILCFYNYWNSATKLNAYEKEVWFFGAGKSETSATFGGTNRDINDYLRIYIDTANFKYYIYYNRYNDRDVKIQELQFFESPDPLHSSFFTNSTTVVNLPTESSTLVRVPIKTTYNHDRTIKTSKSIYASSFYENSDIRLKENIQRIDQSDLTKQVDLVQFNFKDSDTKKYGVIAQQLEQVGLQNLVYENDGKKAVDYISLLVLEIQRLRNEIGELKQEIHKKS